MDVELKVLTWSVVLGFVHIVVSSHAESLQRGYSWTASARDEQVPPLTGVAGRLERASSNYLETFPLFAALVLAAQVAGIHSTLTEWGSSIVSRGARSLLTALCSLEFPSSAHWYGMLQPLACCRLSSRYWLRRRMHVRPGDGLCPPPNNRLQRTVGHKTPWHGRHRATTSLVPRG